MKYLISILMLSTLLTGCSGGSGGGGGGKKKLSDCGFGKDSQDKVNLIDSSFGTDGTKILVHNNEGTSFAGHAISEKCELFLLFDKEVLDDSDNVIPTGNFVVAKFNKELKIDKSFGVNGFAAHNLSDLAGIELSTTQMRGQISIDKGGNLLIGAMGADANLDFFIVRLKPNGEVDNSFDDDGIVQLDFAGGTDAIAAVFPVADEKILAVGQVSSGGTRIGAIRLNKNGSIDTNYGTDGKQLFIPDGASESTVYDKYISENGIFLIGGASFGDTGYRCAALKLNKNGDLIEGFGTDGFVLGDIDSGANQFDICYTASEDHNDNLYIYGESQAGSIVMKIDSDSGDFVENFGTAGITYFDFGSGEDWAHAGAVTKEGKVFVLAAASGWEANLGYSLLKPDGTLDSEFSFESFADESFSQFGDGQIVRDLGDKDFVSPSLLINLNNQILSISTSKIDDTDDEVDNPIKKTVITRFNIK